MGAPSATCSQHATREAVGICVRCRAAMCGECITKIDGINHCRRCLDELSQLTTSRAPGAGARVRLPAFVPIAFGLCLLCALAWLTLEILMPGTGGT